MFQFLVYFSVFSAYIPIVCCLIKFKTLNIPLRVLLFYLLCSAINEAIGLKLGGAAYYFILQNVYTILECLSLITIFYILFGTKFSRRIIFVSAIGFIAITITQLVYRGNYLELNYKIIILESCLMMALALAYYFKLIFELLSKIPRTKENYFVFINAGILIYFASTFVFSLFGPYMANCPVHIFTSLWCLNLFGNIVYHTLLTIGIWKHNK